MPEYMDQSHDHMLNHEPETPMGMVPYPGHPHIAPLNDDQLPIFSKVGRGIAGDAYKVKIKHGNGCTALDCEDCAECEDRENCTCTEFYLEGYNVDGATGAETLEWTSGNLSGGHIFKPTYNLVTRPWNSPPTFNMTWHYHRPPCCDWTWTTPNIPYCWDEQGPNIEGRDFVGSGVGSFFIRTDTKDRGDKIFDKLTSGNKNNYLVYKREGDNPDDDKWIERLKYPPYMTREQYNAPEAREFIASYNTNDGIKDDKNIDPWVSTVTFGLHGDVLVPNIYDLADVVGWKPDEIPPVLEGEEGARPPIQNQIDDHLKNNMSCGYIQVPITHWYKGYNSMCVGGIRTGWKDNGENMEDATMSDVSSDFLYRAFITFHPSIKVFNVRFFWEGLAEWDTYFYNQRGTDDQAPAGSGDAIYWLCGYMAADPASPNLPLWFGPHTQDGGYQRRIYKNYLTMILFPNSAYADLNLDRYWDDQVERWFHLVFESNQYGCFMGIQPNTTKFLVKAGERFTFRSLQAPIFYSDWYCENDIDVDGNPMYWNSLTDSQTQHVKPGESFDPGATISLDSGLVLPDKKLYTIKSPYHDPASENNLC